MSEFLTTVISLCVFMLGTVLAVVWYLGGRVDTRLDGLSGRLDGLTDEVHGLRTDMVAGLGEVRGEIGRIGQRLDDHIANHPGPATTSPPGGH